MVDGKSRLDIKAIVRAAEDGPARTVHESGNQADRAKLTQSSKCSHAETELFYTALQVFGLMANFLKNRTRQQVKSKHLLKWSDKADSLRFGKEPNLTNRAKPGNPIPHSPNSHN